MALRDFQEDQEMSKKCHPCFLHVVQDLVRPFCEEF